MKTVLFLMGIEDSNRVLMRSVTPDGTNYSLHGSIDLHLDLHHPELKTPIVVLGGADITESSGFSVSGAIKPDLIFNAITDADSSPRALKLAMAVIQHYQVPVLNRPVHVLKTRRDDVAAALADIPGLIAPATVRITPRSHREILTALEQGPVRYPAILRQAGTHGGSTMLLLNSADDAPLLEQIACDGSEYYLISFVDFRDDDGLYRKTRLVFVGQQVFARHQLAGSHWNVHASARDEMLERPELLAAEAVFLQAFASDTFPALAERLSAMRQALQLDYFSVDCALRPNGDMVLFEANASGNALRQARIEQFPYIKPVLRQLRAAVTSLLLELPSAATPT